MKRLYEFNDFNKKPLSSSITASVLFTMLFVVILTIFTWLYSGCIVETHETCEEVCWNDCVTYCDRYHCWEDCDYICECCEFEYVCIEECDVMYCDSGGCHSTCNSYCYCTGY